MCWRARRGCGARQPAPHPGDAHGAARATQAGGGAARKAIVYTHIGVHRQLIERALQAKAVPAAVLRGGMNRREQEMAVDVFQARARARAAGRGPVTEQCGRQGEAQHSRVKMRPVRLTGPVRPS